jgi:hypothetical protein
MNPARVVLAMVCLPLALSAQDSTAAAAGDATLMQRLGLRGMHVSFGGGASPYVARVGSSASTAEIRLGATLRRWPAWTVAFASSGVVDLDTTSYVVQNSGGYHPRMAATTTGVEVQRRWSSSSLFHFTATAGAGELLNSYNYFLYPKSGAGEFFQEEVTKVRYATLAAGGELNVSGWARMLITAGYRAAGSTRIASGVGSNSGVVSSVLLELGRF